MPILSTTARRRALGLVVVVAAASLVLAGCTSSSTKTTTSSSKEGGTITLGRVASVTSFDPNTQITSNNAFAIDKVFESLVSFNAKGAIIPSLASKYSISSDGLSYTFDLRKGVKFSDGTKLTPADVVFSLKRNESSSDPLPLDAPITSIAASGSDAVKITLSSPYTPLLAELSGFQNSIFPANFEGKTAAAFFKAPIGTGPFVVSKWDTSGDLTFVKNKNYWQPGKPYIDKLVYKLVSTDTQLVQQLQSGEINAIDEVNDSSVSSLQSNSSVSVETAGSWVIEQLFFNTQNQYFSDRNVRRAVAQALDRSGITKATTFGTAKVANSLIPPTIAYSANSSGYALKYDVTQAKADLAQSKYPKGFTTTLMIPSGDSLRSQEAQIIQSSLAKIGITVKIQSIDLATFRANFFAYKFDFMIDSGQSDYPDPDELVTFQADPSGFSKSYWTHYSNATVTPLLAKARQTPDGSSRKSLYLEIQKILAGDVPYVPFFYPSTIKATSSNVHGVTVLPNGSIDFQDAWISK
ncbi:MAG: transporter substrate-binding protein [Frondihabitans sp.]|nr:transporter substrate-binding protein [Frondihabitans sp.]